MIYLVFSVFWVTALIISSKGGVQEHSVETCGLDDILPTMLVCRQFFSCKHLTISGFILGNLKDYSLDDILPTMLVCKQFFFRNLVPRLIEFGPIVIDMNAG